MLCAVPLQNLLDWLSKPKGPYLVEASAAAAPDKALVLAVTKRMLYGEETPLVGVGLMYKPHYLSTEPFSAAYMHLHVWHVAGSSVESADKLEFVMPYICQRLRNERRDTSCGATSRLVGCGN